MDRHFGYITILALLASTSMVLSGSSDQIDGSEPGVVNDPIPGIACGTDFVGDGHQGDLFLSIELDSLGRIPLVFHVVRDDTGGRGYDPGIDYTVAAGLSRVVDHLNSLFPEPPIDSEEPQFVKFSFFIEDIYDGANVLRLRNDDYVEIADEEISEMRRINRVPGRINVFLVDEIIREGRIIAGTSSFPGSPVQGIVLDWEYLEIQGRLLSFLAHEIAHYFFVYHTYEKELFGKELVNRDPSNCEQRGDKICDTPADPRGGVFLVSCDSCAYVGDEVDPLGQPYSPDPYNIVSDVPGLCARTFTYGQLERMTKALRRGFVGEASPKLPRVLKVFAFPAPGSGASPVRIVFETPPGFSTARAEIYDVRGALVRTLFSGWVDGVDGTQTVEWRASNKNDQIVSSGIYFFQVVLTRSNGEIAKGRTKVQIIK